MPPKEQLWETHPGEKAPAVQEEPGDRVHQSACLSVSESLAFLKTVGSCQTAHPKLLLNQKEKDAELQCGTGNSPELREPELPHGVLALEEKPGPGSFALALGWTSVAPEIQGLSPGNMRG